MPGYASERRAPRRFSSSRARRCVTIPPGGHGRARTMRHPRIVLLLGMGFVVVPALFSAAEGQAPKYGGILVAAPLSAPPSLSPHEEATIATLAIAAPCFNNLVTFAPLQSRHAPHALVAHL